MSGYQYRSHMAVPRRANRGPSAAAENRQALIDAAVAVFGDEGIDAPLVAVARRAGVGQGSLYRHFPDRISLALAVFDQNVVELEELAARPGATLEELLALLTRQTIDSVAFVEIVTATGDEERLDAVAGRVATALDGPVAESRRAERLRPDVGTDEVMLAVGMVAAYVAHTPAPKRQGAADACWAMLLRALETS